MFTLSDVKKSSGRLAASRCGLSLVVAHALGFAACVGDPPPPYSTPSSDGGTVSSDGATNGGGATNADGATNGDGATPPCDLDAPFSAPALVPGIDTPGNNEMLARLSSDELTIYFTSDRAREHDGEPSIDDRDIYVASRTKRTDRFGPPVRVAELTTPQSDSAPMLTPDGRTLFFESTRPGSSLHAIWVATRTETGQFTDIRRLDSLDSVGDERAPFFSPADDALWFGSNRHDPDRSYGIYRAKRNGADFEPPELVEELFTPDSHWFPVLSADGLTIYWGSNRADGGAKGDFDVWRARRSTTSDRFGPPENVSELNTPSAELPTWISPDGCRLYLQRRDESERNSIYVAEKPPKM